MTTILVTGSRDYTGDLSSYFDMLSKIREQTLMSDTVTVIHGGAKGVDTTAAAEGVKRGWTVQEYPANWHTYGKAAGPIRNNTMVAQCPHLALAALYPDSVGTRDCLRRLAHSTKKSTSRLQYCLIVDLETGLARVLDASQLLQEFGH